MGALSANAFSSADQSRGLSTFMRDSSYSLRDRAPLMETGILSAPLHGFSGFGEVRQRQDAFRLEAMSTRTDSAVTATTVPLNPRRSSPAWSWSARTAKECRQRFEVRC